MEKMIPGKKLGSGLVFGKFMPLHDGHIHLLRFAQQSCQRLTILVCSLPTEPIPGEVRFQWVKEMFPAANVVHHYIDIPQDPSEDPNFWSIWNDSIKRHCPDEEFDALFGSEDYGWKMAEKMGIQYIPVNRLRDLVPVSGTAVREHPMENWKYIPSVVRPYFVKRICLVGPESVGKSTMAKRLAEKYETPFVDEYARRLLDEYVANRGYKPGEVREEDIATIARGQIVTEDAMARRANRLLFCDTDLITTVYWSDFFFGKCPDWIAAEAERRKYDLYILLSPDTPWVDDHQRAMPEQEKREAHHKWLEMELIRRGRPFVKISGDWQQRFDQACKAVDRLLQTKTPA